MAEERNLGVARAPEPQADTDATKEHLQRRMEEARESITQTVTEIKETVANQYQYVRETISETLDWREQFRRRPAAFSIGALTVGCILGYSVAGALRGDRDARYYEEEEDTGAGILPASGSRPAYAAQAITSGAYGSTAYERGPAAESTYQRVSPAETPPPSAPDSRPSYSSGYEAATSPEPSKPGLVERFKESKAYDRLQAEISTLGDRVIDELSKTAQTVVLPALLGKLKDLIGIDLSTQRDVAQRSTLEKQATTARAGTAAAEARGSTSATGERRGSDVP